MLAEPDSLDWKLNHLLAHDANRLREAGVIDPNHS
jgi:hypothetical protein